MSHYKEMLEKLDAFRTQDYHLMTLSLVHTAMCRLAAANEKIGLETEALHNGGEFAYDAAIEAAINGWRRVGGKIPNQGKGNLWYETNAPGSTDEGAKLVIKEILIMRDEMEAERMLAKQKQERRKKLKAEGYIKIWVKLSDVQSLLRKSGGLGDEMRIDDGVLRLGLS